MKQKVLLGLLFALVVVGFVATTLRNPLLNEPEYNGKTISQWSEQWRSNRFRIYSGEQDAKAATEEAELSIRQIGTNGIPFLLSWMRERESPVVASLRRIVPRSWQKQLRLDASERNARNLNALGSFGIAALGTNAAPALEALLETISDEKAGPDSVYRTVWSLKYLGPAAEPAIPLLIQCLHHTDSSVRDEAAMAFGYIDRRHDEVVLSLKSFLEWRKGRNGNAESISAIQSLSMLGANASEAAPTILGLLNDPDRWIREAATNCIRRIDPAAALRAGITP